MYRLLLILALTLFMGCVTTQQSTISEPVPVKELQQKDLQKQEEGYRIDVHINDLKISVVDQMGWMPKECQENGTDACLQTNPLHIWIIGHRYKGKIYVDELYLGHEVEHILNLFTPHLGELQIIDPDEFHME